MCMEVMRDDGDDAITCANGHRTCLRCAGRIVRPTAEPIQRAALPRRHGRQEVCTDHCSNTPKTPLAGSAHRCRLRRALIYKTEDNYSQIHDIPRKQGVLSDESGGAAPR